jgi:predicted nucleotidyltransferase
VAVLDQLRQQRHVIAEIATRHGASNVRLFGSAARGEERPDSDIDLLITLDDARGFNDYLALAEELEQLLGRRVDLVTERGLSPHFRRYIEAEARPL